MPQLERCTGAVDVTNPWTRTSVRTASRPMQTFLPYPSFSRSAAVLDMKRLGKQRVEAKQVLQAILDVDKLGQAPNTGQAFVNHPIMHQWAPYPEALLSYTWYICREWRDRGYRDGIMPWLFQVAKLRELRMMHERALDRDSVRRPWWLGAPSACLPSREPHSEDALSLLAVPVDNSRSLSQWFRICLASHRAEHMEGNSP
jgi:hypothetical protein